MATEQQTEGQSPTLEVSELDQLLQKEFKPRSDAAKEAVESAVRTLAAEALSQTALISSDAIASIQAIVAALYEAHAEKKALDGEAIEREMKRTRPLSVVMAEKVAALRAWARERAVAAD